MFVLDLLAAAGAFATGRALALGWQSFRLAFLYIAFLTLFARFLHFALFTEPLFSPAPYGIDFIAGLSFAACGYYWMRTRQMSHQYGFVSKRAARNGAGGGE